MARYKHYDYSQRVMIPVSLEEQLMPGTLEFAIHILVETRMDMSIFDERYHNDETGRTAYDPKVLLKVVLLAYSRGLISSRRIECACMENVTFMAMSCGQQPDHSTIAAFVSSMKDEILPLFRDILLVCEEENLLGGTFFALDGCKLSSNASMEYSGTIPNFKRKKEKIEKQVMQLIEEQVEEDKKDDEDGKDDGSSGISNRKKQVERLKKQSDRIESFLKENGPKIGKQGKEIQSNITDNESCKMVSSHGTIQGYNAQALADNKHQVILHAEAFGKAQDHYLIPPMLDSAKENIVVIGQSEDYFEEKILTADSNYHDPTNLKKCDKEKLDAYIPDKRFRKRDPRFQGKQKGRSKNVDRLTLADFQHNEDTDEYCCPNGKTLKLKAKKAIMDGIIYRRYVADKDDCKGCEFKIKCIRHKNAKRRMLNVPVGYVPGNLSKAMADKIDSKRGREIYHRRIAIIEPVFANIRTHKRMDRFTLRGKTKVNIQWLLYCMVHNMGKIMAYGFTLGT
ncbi:IS1182 family transposase [Thermodesulfobacteriota bacterium]